MAKKQDNIEELKKLQDELKTLTQLFIEQKLELLEVLEEVMLMRKKISQFNSFIKDISKTISNVTRLIPLDDSGQAQMEIEALDASAKILDEEMQFEIKRILDSRKKK